MLKELKNGNIHVRMDEWDVKAENGLLSLYNNYDFIPVGDEFHINNYYKSMYYERNGSYFEITDRELDEFQNGKTLLLTPIEDEFTLELIDEVLERWMN